MSDFSNAINDDFYESTSDEIMRVARRIKDRLGIEEHLENELRRQSLFLTPNAYMVLAAALEDAAYFQRLRQELEDSYELDYDVNDAKETIDAIVAEMKQNPAFLDSYPDELMGSNKAGDERRPMRSSASLLKAVSTKFCRIPPICSKRDLGDVDR